MTTKPKTHELGFKLLATDRAFPDSPDVGDVRCRCSRCGAVIEERCAPAVRVWPKDGSYEYRFHPHCLGVEPCCENDEPWFREIRRDLPVEEQA